MEIGCGDGRDAKEIIKLSDNYVGFDLSEELIKIAKSKVPDAKFEVDDATTREYGLDKYNVVFAFASLLHLNKGEVNLVLKKVHKSLKAEGILFISLKLSEKYEELIKEDRFGIRKFYMYNPNDIEEMITGLYTVENKGGGFITVGNTRWFEMALRKV